MFESISVFSSAFVGVVPYVFESIVVSAFAESVSLLLNVFESVFVSVFESVFVSVLASVSAFPSDFDVADLFLIADPVEAAAAARTLTFVQKQSLI